MARNVISHLDIFQFDEYTKQTSQLSDVDTITPPLSNNATPNSCSSGATLYRVVVKGTFIEIDECPNTRTHDLRRCKSDSELIIIDTDHSILGAKEYQLGVTYELETVMEPASLVGPWPDLFSNGSSPSSSPKTSAQDISSQRAYYKKKQHSKATKTQPDHTQPCKAHAPCPKRRKEKLRSNEKTTVMMRNIPNNYTRSMLLEMIDAEGFVGLYDFVYLPMDFGRRANLGYAFVNLVDAAAAAAFWSAFDGFSHWALPSAKVCQLGWSGPHQGLAAHIDRYRNSPVMHNLVPDEYKPMLFQGGVRIKFPAPTRYVKAPQSNWSG